MKKLLVLMLLMIFFASCGTITEKNATWVRQSQINRSQALPKDLHRWDIGAVYGKFQDVSSTGENTIPWLFTYHKGLSDKLTIHWTLLLPSWTYQLKNTDKIKMSITGGFTDVEYSTTTGTTVIGGIAINSKFILTKNIGISLGTKYSQTAADNDHDNSSILSAYSEVLLQVTDHWLLSTGAGIAINMNPAIQNRYYIDDKQYLIFPFNIQLSWNLSKYVDLNLEYIYSGIDHKNDRQSHKAKLIFWYFW